jgi:hypothetical protein
MTGFAHRVRRLFGTGTDSAPTVFETTPLRPEFAGEHLPGNRVWDGTHVTYLDEQARLRFRLQARDGLLHTADGALFDTTTASTLWSPEGGRAIFVMDAAGTLYSSPQHLLGRFHHSSFLAGGPVAAAGEIVARQGRVLLVSDHSTHYRPPRRFTRQVPLALRAQGIEAGDLPLEMRSQEP